jgi:prephenate dehydrogenase
MNTIAILGLGLMGGSLARRLAELGETVIGYDQSNDIVAAALAEGVLNAAIADDFSGLEQADTVVLAVPVTATAPLLERAIPRLDRATLITDVGSTKRSICDAAEALGVGHRFVGSHPMAGDHKSGWAAGRADLLADSRVFVCPAPSATPTVIDAACRFWLQLGAKPELLNATQHDARLAWISHLPQLSATAIALCLDEKQLAANQLGRGGRDCMRLAGSDPSMWTAIALDNSDHVISAIDALQGKLAELRAAVAQSNAEVIHDALIQCQQWWQRSSSS